MAQGPKGYLLRFLVPKWDLQFSQESTLYFLLNCPTSLWLPQVHQKAGILPAHQVVPVSLPERVSMSLPEDTAPPPRIVSLVQWHFSSRLNLQEETPHQDSFTHPSTSFLPRASLQLLRLAKGFITGGNPDLHQSGYVPLANTLAKDRKLVNFQTILIFQQDWFNSLDSL